MKPSIAASESSLTDRTISTYPPMPTTLIIWIFGGVHMKLDLKVNKNVNEKMRIFYEGKLDI